ncbi:type I polyketide synthase [Spirillospora sp. CA-253888]
MGGADADEIAVIGMGCRFPMASGVDEFWDLLEAGVDAVTPVPADRFDAAAFHHPRPGTPGRTVSVHGGFLDDPFGFDAGFFRIAPVEAACMDPQQRLLLHVVWEALEDAGVPPSTLAGGRCGVFVGQATAEYGEQAWSLSEFDARTAAGGRLRAVTAGRLSQLLDLRGPSVVVDTACSSSLVAVHQARQSLLLGESDLAVAAGVNVIVSPADAIAYSQWGVLSPDGRCKFADAGADGFVRSEGVGVVVLKRLADALADGDPIWGRLAGSAVTNDGDASGLLLQPSVTGQVEMITAACRSAGIAPSRLDYVEAHGTGTVVGDEVELRALAEAAGRGRERPLPVGSVKSNLGHTEAASGIAGLIKALLILRHGLIPASLHVRTPHPLLADGRIPVEVVRGNRPLDRSADAVLGVSSFGVSGTNAHVVVAAPPARAVPSDPVRATPFTTRHHDTPRLLVLSARSAGALRALALAYAAHLEPGGAGHRLPLDRVCAAAARRRDHHPHRLWIVGRDHKDVAAGLRALARGEQTPDGAITALARRTPPRVAFVFPGHGSQWPGMGRLLLETSPVFRDAMRECDRAIRDETGWSVLERLEEDDRITAPDIDVIQPMLWAVEVSLAALWRSLGVEPDLVVGHSMGESAAAQVAGALGTRDAAAVICRRSRLMGRLAGTGELLVVGLAGERAAGLDDEVHVAVENAPDTTVLGGPPQALRRLADRLDRQGVFTRLLDAGIASHTPAVEPLRADLTAALADLEPAPGGTSMISTVTAAPVDGGDLDARYWMENLRRPVRFTQAVRHAADQGPTVFVEMSPHPILTDAVEATLRAADLEGAAVGTLHRFQDEAGAVARAVGRLYGQGVPLDWSRWFGAETGSGCPLPRYPWDSRQYRRHARPATGGAPRAVALAGRRLTRPVAALAGAAAGRVAGPVAATAARVMRRSPWPAPVPRPPSTPADLLVRYVAEILGYPPADIDVDRSLSELGMDSLGAVRLGGRLREEFGWDVDARRLLAAESLAQIARSLPAR